MTVSVCGCWTKRKGPLDFVMERVPFCSALSQRGLLDPICAVVHRGQNLLASAICDCLVLWKFCELPFYCKSTSHIPLVFTPYLYVGPNLPSPNFRSAIHWRRKLLGQAGHGPPTFLAPVGRSYLWRVHFWDPMQSMKDNNVYQL